MQNSTKVVSEIECEKNIESPDFRSETTDKSILNSINFRRMHEKGLLVKMNDIEERLGNYLNSLNRSIEDAAAGRESKPPAPLDTDAVCLLVSYTGCVKK